MGNNKKILLVDDDPKVTAVSSYLEKLGFEMITADNGEAALNIIKNDKPFLVILDIEMPGINGLQVLDIIRKDYKDTKVFIFTAHGKEYISKAKKIGFDKYFDKSIYDLDDLLNSIREVSGIDHHRKEMTAPVSDKLPNAKLLFIEPSMQMYAFTCGLFDNDIFCKGHYTKKVMIGERDSIAGIILNELATFKPDILLINDYSLSEGDIFNLIDLVAEIKIKPDAVIVHGLFERSSIFETQLKMKKVKRCIQNVMAHDELISMNMKLIDFVDRQCVEVGLVQKKK